MKKSTLSGLLIIIIALITMAGCKGTGGDITHAQPTTATLNIMSQGTLTAGQQIGAIDVTVNLPSGVTVKSTPSGTNPNVLVMNPGVVVVSGVAAGANASADFSVYTAATSTLPGNVRVILESPNAGFGVGEFVTVNCNIAAGAFPVASDFNLTNFMAKDLTSAVTITYGLTAGFTADIK